MPHDQPATDSERFLIPVWRKAFARDDIGLSDDFFDLNGDSLIAATIAAEIEETFRLRIPFRIFFDKPALKDMAAELERLREQSPMSPSNLLLEAVSRDGDIPISTLQRWPWWEMSRQPGLAPHAAFAFAFRIEGELDIDALKKALDFTVARHEGLRTRFEAVGDDVLQRIEPPFTVDLTVSELSEHDNSAEWIKDCVTETSQKPYDLARIPLFQFKLLRLSVTDHRLILGLHHILFDDVSLMVLINEIATAYAEYHSGQAPNMPERNLGYADFSAMQHRDWNIKSTRFKVAVAWWKRHYRKARDAANLDALRPLMLSGNDGQRRPARNVLLTSVEPDISRNLSACARDQSTTAYCARFAVTAAVLAHVSQCELVILGSIMTSRYRLGLDNVFGPLAQSLPLMVRCNQQATFNDLLGQTGALLAGAQDYADAPFRNIVEELDRQGSLVPSPPFIVNQVTRRALAESAGLELTPEDMAIDALPSRAVWIRFDRYGDRETCNLTYDPNLYDTNAIKVLGNNLVRVMSAAARDPEANLDHLIGSGCEDY